MPRFSITLAALCLITLSCKSAGETTTKSPKATTSHHSNKKDRKINDPYPNEVPPKIIGGAQALYSRVKYPKEAKRKGVHGTVIVTFVVSKEGKTKDFHIIQSVGYGCDMAAISALKRVHFIPGKKDGKPVNVHYTWPVTFQMR